MLQCSTKNGWRAWIEAVMRLRVWIVVAARHGGVNYGSVHTQFEQFAWCDVARRQIFDFHDGHSTRNVAS